MRWLFRTLWFLLVVIGHGFENNGSSGVIPLDKNEGIYVRNTQTGRVRSVIGEAYMLTPNEVLWEKVLPDTVETLLASGKAARDKAVGGEGSVSRLGAVEVKNMLGLLGYVDKIWNRSLHLEGHFILGDPSSNLRVILPLAQQVVQSVNGVQEVSLVVS